MKLEKAFYLEGDVVDIARNLLGKKIVTEIDGHRTAGLITETEAYRGADDKACHAYGYKRTKRTEVMFQEGGKAYIYLCYGIHHLFNIVTNIEGEPNAVLVRGIFPSEGEEIMRNRRKISKAAQKIGGGPGTLSQALGITTHLDGTSLMGEKIWLENGHDVNKDKIAITKRIGIDYAGDDADLPWRFVYDLS